MAQSNSRNLSGSWDPSNQLKPTCLAYVFDCFQGSFHQCRCPLKLKTPALNAWEPERTGSVCLLGKQRNSFLQFGAASLGIQRVRFSSCSNLLQPNLCPNASLWFLGLFTHTFPRFQQVARIQSPCCAGSVFRTHPGPPVAPFYRFFFGWEGSPTKIDYRTRMGTLILTSLLENLGTLIHLRFKSCGLSKVYLSGVWRWHLE